MLKKSGKKLCKFLDFAVYLFKGALSKYTMEKTNVIVRFIQ